MSEVPVTRGEYVALVRLLKANASTVADLQDRHRVLDYDSRSCHNELRRLVELLGIKEELVYEVISYPEQDEESTHCCDDCYRKKSKSCWFGGCPDLGETEEEFNNREGGIMIEGQVDTVRSVLETVRAIVDELDQRNILKPCLNAPTVCHRCKAGCVKIDPNLCKGCSLEREGGPTWSDLEVDWGGN